jgi:hypothetical protein
MSFSNKPNRPDSKDTAKLRAEYDNYARQSRETSDKASAAALRDKKQKAFERVKEQIVAERRDNLAGLHKVLIQQGKLLSKDEHAKLKAAAAAGGK